MLRACACCAHANNECSFSGTMPAAARSEAAAQVAQRAGRLGADTVPDVLFNAQHSMHCCRATAPPCAGSPTPPHRTTVEDDHALGALGHAKAGGQGAASGSRRMRQSRCASATADTACSCCATLAVPHAHMRNAMRMALRPHEACMQLLCPTATAPTDARGFSSAVDTFMDATSAQPPARVAYACLATRHAASMRSRG